MVDGKMVRVECETITRGIRSFNLGNGDFMLNDIIAKFPKKATRWVKMYRRALKAGLVPAAAQKWPFLKRVKLFEGGVELGEIPHKPGYYLGFRDGEFYWYNNNTGDGWNGTCDDGFKTETGKVAIERAKSLNLPLTFVQLPRPHENYSWHEGRIAFEKNGDLWTADNWKKGGRMGKAAAYARKLGLPVNRVSNGSRTAYPC